RALGVVDQGAEPPAAPGGQRDRPDPLDQELPRALPLAPVAEQRFPLLEARVAGGNPQHARHLSSSLGVGTRLARHYADGPAGVIPLSRGRPAGCAGGGRAARRVRASRRATAVPASWDAPAARRRQAG